MKLALKRGMVILLGMAIICLLGSPAARGQATPVEKPLLAEQVFKNVQVLRGISVGEFMDTMGFLASSLDANCTTCHGEAAVASTNWDGYAADVTPAKQTARMMIIMVNAINQQYFGGKQVVTCYSCHRFGKIPKVAPELAIQYGAAPEQDPDEILTQAPGRSTPDKVLDDYFKAIGGAAKLSGITIIAYTAHALIGDELKAKASGCDDYLSKPCLPKEVVEKVAAWVERKRAAGPAR